jgi:ubiquitin carboxyl-terminal hydrolase 14
MSDSTTTTATAIASNNEDTTTKDKGKEPILGGDLEDEGIYRAKEAAEFEALVDSSLKNDLGSSTTGLYELVAIVTHKGAAADSGHYIGFVKKSVFYDAQAKAKLNTEHTRKVNNTIETLVNTPLPESLESGGAALDPMFRSVADSLMNRTAAVPSQSASMITEQTGLDSASVPGPSTSSTETFASEEDEDWFKFDDDKVIDFPKEKLPTLEGGGEDSSANVLVYRSKVL